MIADAYRGVALIAPEPGVRPQPVARWPDTDLADLAPLVAMAEAAVARRRGVIRQVGEAVFVGYPFLDDERLLGVVALEIAARSQADLKLVMRQLQWGGAWLQLNLGAPPREAAGASRDHVVTALEQVGHSLEHAGFRAAANAVATEAATSLECERVSVGFVRGRSVRPTAISHSADFGERSNLVRAIAAAMDEAVDQREAIRFPPPDGATYQTVAHAALAEESKGLTVCTVPFTVDGKLAGAWTFERARERPFDAETMPLLQYFASSVGPILDLKRKDERWLGTKAVEAAHRQLTRLLGPGFVGRKVIAAAASVLAIFFAIYSTTFRVSADATLEGQVQRAVTAPMDGYIYEVAVRAGDVVRQGDLLVALDDRDLRLEEVKWTTRKAQLERSRQDALGRHERAESRIYKAQADQADAELALLAAQLARTSIRAPFDGLIVSGDLTQSLGAPVGRGDVLMEVAPLEAYRVAISVDERDIRYVEVGQTGQLILPSVPNRSFDLRVSKVTPVATADQGSNVFRVEADLIELSEDLRPGMEGTAKVAVAEQKLIWIWTHRFTDWLRVWVWSWWY